MFIKAELVHLNLNKLILSHLRGENGPFRSNLFSIQCGYTYGSRLDLHSGWVYMLVSIQIHTMSINIHLDSYTYIFILFGGIGCIWKLFKRACYLMKKIMILDSASFNHRILQSDRLSKEPMETRFGI